MKSSVPCLVDAERAAHAHDAAIATPEGAGTADLRFRRRLHARRAMQGGLASAAMALAACAALTACNDKITAVDPGSGGSPASGGGGTSTGGGGNGGAPGGGAGARPSGQGGAATGGAPGGAAATGGTLGVGGSTITSPDGGLGTCHAVTEQHPSVDGLHVTYCSALTFDGNPPASGPHYPSWPDFKVYDQPVPWGYLLHALEHGAIVISYNCPNGCAADIAAAKAFIASLPNKANCTTPSVVMSPSPTLDVPFAASAWSLPWAYTLKAQCFDATVFRQFYLDHVDQNYESTCGGGDWSSNGWCPPGTPPPCGSGC